MEERWDGELAESGAVLFPEGTAIVVRLGAVEVDLDGRDWAGILSVSELIWWRRRE